MSTNELLPSRPDGETPLDLDYYLLLDPQTQRVRFTRTGRDALARRFARCGVDLRRLLTLADVEDAIATVVAGEYRRLTPQQEDDEALTNAIDDLHFIVHGVRGRPLAPLAERRRRMREAERKLLDLLGIPS